VARNPTSSFLSKVVAPWPLLVGAAMSFMTCCAAGHALRDVNCYGDLQRFHCQINYLSLHYPTVAHIRALARSRFDPNKTLVVVGGNSVLYGSGVSIVDLWTTRLQAILGQDYQVLNLAMCGAQSAEFGETAAEVLSRDFPKIVFVSNIWADPTCPLGDPDGRPYIRYFFWEAHQYQWLLHDPIREERIERLLNERSTDASFRELRLQVATEDGLYFRDLWTSLECTHISTIWSPPVAAMWWMPRRARPDPDVASAPVPDTAAWSPGLDAELRRLRGLIEHNRNLLNFISEVRGPRACGVATDIEQPASLADCFPEKLRKSTVMLVCDPNPYFVNQLNPEERADYYCLAAQTVEVLQQSGMTALEIGKNYPVECFYDHVHLSVEGHRRLANEVAPQVRRLARQLGYVGGEAG